jgi:hypothetical protein
VLSKLRKQGGILKAAKHGNFGTGLLWGYMVWNFSARSKGLGVDKLLIILWNSRIDI